MLTTVDVPGSGDTGDTAGPVTSAVAGSTERLCGPTSTTAQRGASDIAAVEYYLDDVTERHRPGHDHRGGLPHRGRDRGTQRSAPGSTWSTSRGQDAAGNWGPLSSVLVTGADAGGPTTSGPTLDPAPGPARPAARSRSVATGDDSASGNSTINAAEYFLDSPGADGRGSGDDRLPDRSGGQRRRHHPGRTWSTDLAEGGHPVYVHTKDAQGNWGSATVNATLVVDTTGPVVTDGDALTVSPNPSNGNAAVQQRHQLDPSQRHPAHRPALETRSRARSRVPRCSSTPSTAPGSGVPLRAVDGSFSDPVEGGYADIPLTTVRALSDGDHTISVRAKDAAGNWGALATTNLVVDKAGPTTANASRRPDAHPGRQDGDHHRHGHRRSLLGRRRRVLPRHRPRRRQRYGDDGQRLGDGDGHAQHLGAR